MPINNYAGACVICGGHVPAKGGCIMKRGRGWGAVHLACEKTGRPAVHTIRFASGATMTQNARGRCEDAPCCGCCT